MLCVDLGGPLQCAGLILVRCSLRASNQTLARVTSFIRSFSFTIREEISREGQHSVVIYVPGFNRHIRQTQVCEIE